MEIEKDCIVFSSGHRVYANRGIIGLSPELDITEGCDGGFGDEWSDNSMAKIDGLSPEDILELSDYMVARWEEVAEMAVSILEDNKRLTKEFERFSAEEQAAKDFFSGK